MWLLGSARTDVAFLGTMTVVLNISCLGIIVPTVERFTWNYLEMVLWPSQNSWAAATVPPWHCVNTHINAQDQPKHLPLWWCSTDDQSTAFDQQHLGYYCFNGSSKGVPSTDSAFWLQIILCCCSSEVVFLFNVLIHETLRTRDAYNYPQNTKTPLTFPIHVFIQFI